MKRLLEKKGQLAAEIKRMAGLIAGEKKEFTAEERGAWEKVNAEFDQLAAQIQIAERAAQVGEIQPMPGRENVSGEEKPVSDLVKGFRSGAKEFDVSLRSFYGVPRESLREKRDLSTASGNAPVGAAFQISLDEAMLAFGAVRRVATVIRTPKGDAMEWPTINDTGNSAAKLAEATTISTSVDPTFGKVTLNAYKYSSGVVLVSAELIQDSAYNLEQVLGNLIGIRLGRGTNAALTTGDGNGDPNGIVVASTAGVTAASATAFTADELYDLVHSVDPAYRGMPGCAFMMHDSVIKAIRKLKNGDGQYLWQPGLGVGSPDRLLGYPVEVNQQMAGTIEASAKIALFGDFSKYMVREVAGLRFRKLEERYADTDQVAYIAFLRMDGDLIDAGTHPVKHLIMHA